MPIFILSILIQVAFVIHIVKTGRNTTWIWIVIMLPLAGSIAYLILEILPEITASRSGRKTGSKIGKLLNPDKEINQAAQNYSIVDTVENSLTLAKEFLNKNMFEEAKEIYNKCLKGLHEHDPEIMQGLATAEFGIKNYTEVKVILDDLIAKNPDYKNADAHLLYARTLEKLNRIDAALEEYQVLNSYFPGPEASYRYAMLLKKCGDSKKSIELINKIIFDAKNSSEHYNSLYRDWIKSAKNESIR